MLYAVFVHKYINSAPTIYYYNILINPKERKKSSNQTRQPNKWIHILNLIQRYYEHIESSIMRLIRLYFILEYFRFNRIQEKQIIFCHFFNRLECEIYRSFMLIFIFNLNMNSLATSVLFLLKWLNSVWSLFAWFEELAFSRSEWWIKHIMSIFARESNYGLILWFELHRKMK